MSKPIFISPIAASKTSNLKGKYLYGWTEESLEIVRSESNEGQREFLGVSISSRHLRWLLFVCVFIFGLIFFRTAYLQIFKGNEYLVLAEANRIRIKDIVSERGIIYDRDKKALLENVPNFALTIIPQDLPVIHTLEGQLARKKVIKKVVELAGIDEIQINNLLEKYSSYSYASLVIKEDVDYQVALKIYLAGNDLPGIYIEKNNKRKYFNTIDSATQPIQNVLSLSHIVGYLSKLSEEEYKNFKNSGYLLFDSIGKLGLEKVYESVLRGQYGKKKVEVDSNGREKRVLTEDSPKPGDNLILGIDFVAQQKLQAELQKILDKYHKNKAAAIAFNPNTGSVLALVSLPAFDNNDFSGGIKTSKYQEYLTNKNNPLFNRTASGAYPSGSTIKMVVAAGALQEGIINYNTTFLSKGGLTIDRWFFPDWLSGGHGVTNVTKAIAWSVNTFFYYIGGGYGEFNGLGVEKMKKYMEMFGLGYPTGIDLSSEESGFIPDKNWKLRTKKEPWYIGDTYNLSIGQGDLLVTPLQVAIWTAAVANGGKLVRPHLVDYIEDAQTKNKTEIKSQIKNIGISSANMKIIKQGMGECVNYGSCGMLKYLSFSSGGKTGTAQWTDNNKQNHAWFTSFAPYDNPQIVVTVLIEEGEEGAATALPVAYEFLKWWGSKYLR